VAKFDPTQPGELIRALGPAVCGRVVIAYMDAGASLAWLHRSQGTYTRGPADIWTRLTHRSLLLVSPFTTSTPWRTALIHACIVRMLHRLAERNAIELTLDQWEEFDAVTAEASARINRTKRRNRRQELARWNAADFAPYCRPDAPAFPEPWLLLKAARGTAIYGYVGVALRTSLALELASNPGADIVSIRRWYQGLVWGHILGVPRLEELDVAHLTAPAVRGEEPR
jgi:hypothetical protein